MPYVSPPDKASGDIVTEQNWDTHLKGNLDFLHQPPMAQAYAGTPWLYSAGTANITFDSERFDTDAMHGTASPGRLTVSTPGVYLIHGAATGAAASVNFLTRVKWNGTLQAVGDGTNVVEGAFGRGYATAVLTALASAADYFELDISSAGAGTLSSVSLTALWQGAA